VELRNFFAKEELFPVFTGVFTAKTAYFLGFCLIQTTSSLTEYFSQRLQQQNRLRIRAYGNAQIRCNATGGFEMTNNNVFLPKHSGNFRSAKSRVFCKDKLSAGWQNLKI